MTVVKGVLFESPDDWKFEKQAKQAICDRQCRSASKVSIDFLKKYHLIS